MMRAEMMSRVRAKDTQPELIVRRGLHCRGYRFRLHRKNFLGRPDLVLSKYRAAIFVNGCFWHAHQGCQLFWIPSTRTGFWTAKLMRNRERDVEVREALREAGWRVLTVWECSVREIPIASLTDRIVMWLESDAKEGDISQLYQND
jgi:DNA mismatch endonuclease (patch repair protein)